MRVRGLKHPGHWQNSGGCLSHPVRVRGLKQGNLVVDHDDGDVAPRAGAWVETVIAVHTVIAVSVAPRAGAWVETPSCLTLVLLLERRTPCGCVG